MTDVLNRLRILEFIQLLHQKWFPTVLNYFEIIHHSSVKFCNFLLVIFIIYIGFIFLINDHTHYLFQTFILVEHSYSCFLSCHNVHVIQMK